LLDLSGKIDQQEVDALLLIKKIADSLNIPFFIVGASARDFILKHDYGVNPSRITRDIDLGAKVENWEKFRSFVEALKDTGKFSNDGRQLQRYLFDSVIIDIVPFGPITDKNKRITWPPENEVFMSVVGFKEAYESAITVKLSNDPQFEVKLSTLPGLTLMKIISWNENYPVRTKDAEDILLIMNEYGDPGNKDRLFDEEEELLQIENFDTKHAGIRLLGRDMAEIADTETKVMVKTILDDETDDQNRYRLVADMIGSHMDYKDKFEEILLLLQKLKQGFSES